MLARPYLPAVSASTGEFDLSHSMLVEEITSHLTDLGRRLGMEEHAFGM